MSELLTVEESAWARRGRRVVTIPLYLLLATLSAAHLPVTIALALVCFREDTRLSFIRRGSEDHSRRALAAASGRNE
jgi:hypothetical protein